MCYFYFYFLFNYNSMPHKITSSYSLKIHILKSHHIWNGNAKRFSQSAVIDFILLALFFFLFFFTKHIISWNICQKFSYSFNLFLSVSLQINLGNRLWNQYFRKAFWFFYLLGFYARALFSPSNSNRWKQVTTVDQLIGIAIKKIF